MHAHADQPDPAQPPAAAPAPAPAVPAPTPAAVRAPAPAPSRRPARRRGQRLLLLAHRVPYPPDRGDRIRSFHLLEYLASTFDVAVACTSDEPVRLPQRQHLQELARRVAIEPIDPTYSRLRALAALAAGRPLTPAYFFRRRLAGKILRWHAQEPFDAVLTICTGMIDYARPLTREPGGPRHVLDLVDVDSAKWEAYAAAAAPPMRWIYAAEAQRLAPIEAGVGERFDAVTLVSAAEAELYTQRAPGSRPPVVVNNGVDLSYFTATPDPMSATVSFVGVLDYAPNVEAIVWFVREAWPGVKAAVPEARLLVIGKHPAPAVRALGGEPGVEVVGAVPDVRVYLARSAVVIAPLQLARGVQNKVLEGMAAGRVVVCTPTAAKGVDAQPGRDLLVAQTPRDWVDLLRKLLREPDYRRGIAQAARRRVEERYAWSSCLEPMGKLLRGEG